MSNSKYLFLSALILSVLLIFSPQIARADMAAGFLLYNLPLLLIVAFFGVWIIEALVINKKLGGSSQKAIFVSLIVNLATSLLGFVVAIVVKKLSFNWPTQEATLNEIAISFIILFAASFILEAILLRFFYRQSSKSQINITSLIMNGQSYAFLLVLIFFDITTILGAIFVLVIIPYFFLKLFNLVTTSKEIPKSKKTVLRILVIIGSLVICGLIFWGAIKGIEKGTGSKRALARDARRQADMRQLVEAQENYYDENGHYDGVQGCQSKTSCFPSAIEGYITLMKDPYGQEPYQYKGFNNDNSPEKFCYYAKLERERKECLFFIASHKGNFCMEKEPTSLTDCD